MSVRQNMLLLICSSGILIALLLLSLDEGMKPPSTGKAPEMAAVSTGEVVADRGRAAERCEPVRSPAEVVSILQELHSTRSYGEVAGWIVENERERMIALLRAVDEVMVANGILQAAAQEHYHTPASDGWNLSAMENNLGPFSSRIHIINQKFTGDLASVTLQEGSNIPLTQARFEWNGAAWQYRPAATPDSMVPELYRLAKILRDIAGSIEQGASFEAYMDAFHYRVLPQMARVVTIQDEPDEVAAVSVGKLSGARLSEVGGPAGAEYAPR